MTDGAAPQPLAEPVDAGDVAKRLGEVLGDRLLAVYRYGRSLAGDEAGGRLLVVVDAIDMDLLKTVGPITVRSRKGGLRVRLDTREDLLDSADTSPILTLVLLDSRQLLAGEDVLAGLGVEAADLRLRVEQALRNLLQELVDAYLFAPRNELMTGRALRRAGQRLVYSLEGLLLVKGHLQSTSGERAPSKGPDGLLEACAPLTSEAERATLRRLWRFVGGEVDVAGDELTGLFGATLELLKTLIRHADTHGKATGS